jgi:uncharacterized membrane protein
MKGNAMSSADSTEFDFGPIEFVLLGFDGRQLDSVVREAVEDLHRTKAIRLLDLVVVSSNDEGELSVAEVEDMSDDHGFGGIELVASGIAADEDLIEFAEMMPPGTSAAVAVIEIVWAKELASKLARSGGFVIHSERVPAPVVNAALAELTLEG